MTTTLHIKRGIEFRPDLYNSRDRSAWLEAVGKELQDKGLTITVGEGQSAKEIKTPPTSSQPTRTCRRLLLPADLPCVVTSVTWCRLSTTSSSQPPLSPPATDSTSPSAAI